METKEKTDKIAIDDVKNDIEVSESEDVASRIEPSRSEPGRGSLFIEPNQAGSLSESFLDLDDKSEADKRVIDRVYEILRAKKLGRKSRNIRYSSFFPPGFFRKTGEPAKSQSWYQKPTENRSYLSLGPQNYQSAYPAWTSSSYGVVERRDGQEYQFVKRPPKLLQLRLSGGYEDIVENFVKPPSKKQQRNKKRLKRLKEEKKREANKAVNNQNLASPAKKPNFSPKTISELIEDEDANLIFKLRIDLTEYLNIAAKCVSEDKDFEGTDLDHRGVEENIAKIKHPDVNNRFFSLFCYLRSLITSGTSILRKQRRMLNYRRSKFAELSDVQFLVYAMAINPEMTIGPGFLSLIYQEMQPGLEIGKRFAVALRDLLKRRAIGNALNKGAKSWALQSVQNDPRATLKDILDIEQLVKPGLTVPGGVLLFEGDSLDTVEMTIYEKFLLEKETVRNSFKKLFIEILIGCAKELLGDSQEKIFPETKHINEIMGQCRSEDVRERYREILRFLKDSQQPDKMIEIRAKSLEKDKTIVETLVHEMCLDLRWEIGLVPCSFVFRELLGSEENLKSLANQFRDRLKAFYEILKAPKPKDAPPKLDVAWLILDEQDQDPQTLVSKTLESEGIKFLVGGF